MMHQSLHQFDIMLSYRDVSMSSTKCNRFFLKGNEKDLIFNHSH